MEQSKIIDMLETYHWVHGGSMEVPPYYAENNDSSTSQQGPTGRATVFREKKRFPPDCWDPPATPSHARKCVRAKKNDSAP